MIRISVAFTQPATSELLLFIAEAALSLGFNHQILISAIIATTLHCKVIRRQCEKAEEQLNIVVGEP